MINPWSIELNAYYREKITPYFNSTGYFEISPSQESQQAGTSFYVTGYKGQICLATNQNTGFTVNPDIIC